MLSKIKFVAKKHVNVTIKSFPKTDKRILYFIFYSFKSHISAKIKKVKAKTGTQQYITVHPQVLINCTFAIKVHKYNDIYRQQPYE